MKADTVTDAELHAYADAQLAPARQAEIQAYLASHAPAAERVRAYQAQNQALKQLFDPVLDEALPDSLRQLALAPAMPATPMAAAAPAPAPASPQQDRLPRGSLQRIAAGVAIAVVSGAAGWLAHGQRYEAQASAVQQLSLPRQAAVAHVVYSPDVRRPVEISAEHEDQLVAWLTKRLGAPIHPPRLGALGYALIGGRLLPGNSGPVAQFMYHDASGQRLTLYVSTETLSNRDTAFRFAQEGPVSVFYWIDGKFGYALSAGIPKDELARVATAVYEQLDNK